MAFADKFRWIETAEIDSEFAARIRRLSGCDWPPKDSAEMTVILARAGYSSDQVDRILCSIGAEGFEGVGEMPAGYVSSDKDDWPTFSAKLIAGLDRWHRENVSAKGQDNEAGDGSQAAVHSPDFRSVNWFGKQYSFTGNQAAAVKLLWEAWQSRAPDVGGETLLQAADASTQRIDVMFRGNPALGAMIVQGGTKGSYRLTETIADSPKGTRRKAKKTSARARK